MVSSRRTIALCFCVLLVSFDIASSQFFGMKGHGHGQRALEALLATGILAHMFRLHHGRHGHHGHGLSLFQGHHGYNGYAGLGRSNLREEILSAAHLGI